MSLKAGERLGLYEILGLIGGGGMGEVYRAQDTRLQRRVAIKILHRDATGGAWRRLLSEARAAAPLSHPSIVTVYSVEEVENQCFIVMELVDGGTLADRLARGPLDFSDICDIGAQVADALSEAHAMGIIHHDITPRNILLRADGFAKLGDFGLSRAIDPERVSLESTRTGPQLAGTLHYMSPEQIRGEACTARTDLFSFASVLYQAATGRRPFDGANQFAVLEAISTADPPLPSTLRPHLPPAFDTLLRRLHTKAVEERTIEPAEVARALRSLKISFADRTMTTTTKAHETALDKRAFVGRTRELTMLASALVRASAGAGTTIAIAGDAGVGKTSLVDGFLNASQTLASNPLVCRGQSIEHTGAGEAYFPLIDALTPFVAHKGQGLHEVIRTDAPSWWSQFPRAFPGQEVASTPPTSARLARELGDALSAAARSRPVILILEDLHWADPSTIELLRHLAHRAPRAGLVIIGTYRMDEAAGPGAAINQLVAELEARGACDTIELGRLDEDSVREYLERRFKLGEDLPALACLLFKVTEGHPLFLISLVQLFIQRGDLRQIGDEWHLDTSSERLQLAIPRTVEAVIRRKLATLDDADRRLLQYASVEGHEFSTAVLSVLVGTEPMLLEECLNVVTKRPRLITAIGPERFPNGTWGTRYRFVHALYQNVVYDELTPSRKADLHRQVGERLEQVCEGRTTGIAPQLARHFKEGRDWDRAFEYYVQAGDNSMTLSAAREAEAHYGEAIALASVEGTGVTPRALAIALRKRAFTSVFHGRWLPHRMADFSEALIVASRTGDRDLVFDIRLDIFYAHAHAEQVDAAFAAAASLEQDMDPVPGGLKRLRYLLANLQLQIARGEIDKAASEADHAVTLGRSLDESVQLWTALTVRAKVRYYRAEYASALRDLDEVCSGAATRVRRLADPRPASIQFHTTLNLGRVLGDLGQISKALAELDAGLQIARADGYAYWIPRFLNAFAGLHCEMGALDVALQQDGESGVQAVDHSEIRIESRLNQITACLRLGRLDRTATLMADATTLIRANNWFSWLWRVRFAVIAAEEALVRGACTRALELALEGNELARRHKLWKDVVIAERLMAEAAAAEGNWSRASAHIREALDILTVHPVPILAWKVHATAARIHWHSGRHGEAASERDRARSEIRLLSEQIHEEKLKLTFLESRDVRQIVNDSGRH